MWMCHYFNIAQLFLSDIPHTMHMLIYCELFSFPSTFNCQILVTGPSNHICLTPFGCLANSFSPPHSLPSIRSAQLPHLMGLDLGLLPSSIDSPSRCHSHHPPCCHSKPHHSLEHQQPIRSFSDTHTWAWRHHDISQKGALKHVQANADKLPAYV